MSTAIRGIRSGCCARAISGHAAAAPPINEMNSRRLIPALDPTKGHRSGSNWRIGSGPMSALGQKQVQCKTECPLSANSGHSVIHLTASLVTASLSIRQQDGQSCIRQDVLGCPAKYPLAHAALRVGTLD